MENLLRILEAIVSDSTSYGFCVAILVWFGIGVLCLMASATSGRSVATGLINITPNGLATLGVLGTFTGILIGLLDFDVNDIDQSVPYLLEGLKIAFTTSIAGILASITFRIIKALIPMREGSEDVTGKQIYRVLKSIRDDGKKAATRSEELLSGLRKAISSDGDSSLLTQVQKLRTAVQDGQSDLINEFREFSKHMVENNQKAIIEALETVIKDFNENLTEQFGDNFKELNTAVHALVEWQERYKIHLDAMEARIETAVKATEVSADSLQKVEEHAGKIPEAISTLGPVLIGLQAQIDLLEGNLAAVSELRGKAIEAFPIIEKNLEGLTTGFTKSVDEAVLRSSKALTDSEASQAKLETGYASLLQNSDKAQERFSTAISDAMKEMADQTTASFEQHGKLIETGSREANQAISDSWAQNGEKMNSQFADFDTQMQQELTRCLELLGRQLAAVSQKLVDDYSQLMQNLNTAVAADRNQ